MKCNNCGHELPSGSGFCENCGMILSADMPEANATGRIADPAKAAEFDALIGADLLGVAPVHDTFEDVQSKAEASTPQPAPRQFIITPDQFPLESDDFQEPVVEAEAVVDQAAEDTAVIQHSEMPTSNESEVSEDPETIDTMYTTDEPITEPEPIEVEPVEQQTDYAEFAEPVEAAEFTAPAVDESFIIPEETSKNHSKGPLVAAIVVVLIVAVAAGAMTIAKGELDLSGLFKKPSSSQVDTLTDSKIDKNSNGSDAESTTASTTEPTTESTTESATETNSEATSRSAFPGGAPYGDTKQTTSSKSKAQTTVASTMQSSTVPSTKQSTTAQSTQKQTTEKQTTNQTAKPSTTNPTTKAITQPSTTQTTTQPTVQPEKRKTPAEITEQGLPDVPEIITLPKKLLKKGYSAYVAIEGGVRFRNSASGSARSSGSSKFGRAVIVLATEGKWAFVYSPYYEIYGWVRLSAISESRPAAKTDTKVKGLQEPNEMLDEPYPGVADAADMPLLLRKIPAVDSEIIDALEDKQPVTVLAQSSDGKWLYVKDITTGYYGWVTAIYIIKTK